MAEIELSPEELTMVRELFDELDVDGNGTLEHQDIMKVMDKMGVKVSEAEAKAIIAKADKDNSGSVCFDEFVTSLCEEARRVRVSRLRRAFQQIDEDGNGQISSDELKKLVREYGGAPDITDAQIQEFMKAVDTDGSGSISFEEFINIWDRA
eukprot:GHVU01193067.1.p1 GENE.GHVU01193067.1~~GHVU01193067.1.p1  ORF type:complete len:152 (-),score=31.94 GHVU01193067.1:399-854(-)